MNDNDSEIQIKKNNLNDKPQTIGTNFIQVFFNDLFEKYEITFDLRDSSLLKLVKKNLFFTLQFFIIFSLFSLGDIFDLRECLSIFYIFIFLMFTNYYSKNNIDDVSFIDKLFIPKNILYLKKLRQNDVLIWHFFYASSGIENFIVEKYNFQFNIFWSLLIFVISLVFIYQFKIYNGKGEHYYFLHIDKMNLMPRKDFTIISQPIFLMYLLFYVSQIMVLSQILPTIVLSFYIYLNINYMDETYGLLKTNSENESFYKKIHYFLIPCFY